MRVAEIRGEGPRQCCHLGSNKKVSNAEVYAIYRALYALDQRQASGHRYTVFADSSAAIDRIRKETIGPGQRLAVATLGVCARILGGESEVTARWIPAHHGVTGNGRADEYAKAAAEGKAPRSEVPDEYRWGTGLSNMSRGAATGAGSRATAQWISSHVGPKRGYRPAPRRNSVAGRYHQPLSGHAAIGPCLHNKILNDRC